MQLSTYSIHPPLHWDSFPSKLPNFFGGKTHYFLYYPINWSDTSFSCRAQLPTMRHLTFLILLCVCVVLAATLPPPQHATPERDGRNVIVVLPSEIPIPNIREFLGIFKPRVTTEAPWGVGDLRSDTERSRSQEEMDNTEKNPPNITKRREDE